MQGPAFQEGVDDKLVKVLYIVSRDVIGVNDLVEDKCRSVVNCGEVSIHLWCEDVIVVVQQCQLLHRAEVDLQNDSSIWLRRWRLPSRWCEEW